MKPTQSSASSASVSSGVAAPLSLEAREEELRNLSRFITHVVRSLCRWETTAHRDEESNKLAGHFSNVSLSFFLLNSISSHRRVLARGDGVHYPPKLSRQKIAAAALSVLRELAAPDIHTLS